MLLWGSVALGVQESSVVALWETIVADYAYYESLHKVNDLAQIFRYLLKQLAKVLGMNVDIYEPVHYYTYDASK